MEQSAPAAAILARDVLRASVGSPLDFAGASGKTAAMLHPLHSSAIIDIAARVEWSGAELGDAIARRAIEFAERGVGGGSRVALEATNSAEFLADLFAAWSRGAAVACLDPGLTTAERDRLIDFVRPAVVATRAGLDVFGGPASAPSGAVELDSAALILFTSGTTGDPKAVVLSFRAILARVALNCAAIGADALKRTLVTLPVSFGHGLIGNALTPLFAGGTIILHPLGLALASRLGSIVDERQVTFLSSVPALWRIALKLADPPRANCLQRVHVGSAPLSAQLWQQIVTWSGAEVVNCYGTTETANWIGGASSRDSIAEGAVGAPWGGRAGIVRNDQVEASGEGEIALLTPSLMSGYLDRPELTSAVLAHGWYRTGDFGTVDGDGRIRLVGRLTDRINRAGFKVQPEEIDRLLERHPAVDEACCFALPDPVSGELVAAAVKLKAGAQADPEALRSWCLARIRREAAPERLFIVGALPRTVSGKLRRTDMHRFVTEGA